MIAHCLPTPPLHPNTAIKVGKLTFMHYHFIPHLIEVSTKVLKMYFSAKGCSSELHAALMSPLFSFALSQLYTFLTLGTRTVPVWLCCNIIRFGVDLWQIYHNGDVFSWHPIRWPIIFIPLFADGFYFDHLFKAMSARLLHNKVILFLFSSILLYEFCGNLLQKYVVFCASSNFQLTHLINLYQYVPMNTCIIQWALFSGY